MKLIRIHPNDTVVIALEDLKKGSALEFEGATITCEDDIPFGHKIAVEDIGENADVIKFGEIIGKANSPIKRGDWVHVHNVKGAAGESVEYKYEYNKASVKRGTSDKTFMGYERKSGEAGIRNYVAIIPTVFCANGPAEKLAKMMSIKYPNCENFDGFMALCHGSGCSQSGEDLNVTSKVLANLTKSPNFGGVLVMSLGCEVNDLKQMMPFIGDYDEERVKFMTLQDEGDEYEIGMKLLEELYAVTIKDFRKPLNIDKLCIGYNCGGSDGFSGITANRLVGDLTDKLTALGATTNLTEVPEMFGAEHILMNRSKDENVFRKMVDMINNYKAYFRRYGENPELNATQGNIEGGITTLADKSLGCIQKGGKSEVADVVLYGERIKEKGFNVIVGPGNDLAGITAQVAAGSAMIIFTTGRGTPAGFIGPTFRMSTNNTLYNKKPGWNDFNAGRLLTGESPEALTEELYEKILETANGNYRTKNELNGFYQMGILKDGVTD